MAQSKDLQNFMLQIERVAVGVGFRALQQKDLSILERLIADVFPIKQKA